MRSASEAFDYRQHLQVCLIVKFHRLIRRVYLPILAVGFLLVLLILAETQTSSLFTAGEVASGGLDWNFVV
jgi:hypothetical protein